MNDNELRCGFVAVVGRPNVGKSTLINRLVGQKVSITTDRPQTTRQAILGIRTEPAWQIVFVDTPGIHQGQKRQINRLMNRIAVSALQDADLILWLVEAQRLTDEDEVVLSHVVKAAQPVILVVNKIDQLADKTQLLPLMDRLGSQADFAEIVPVSALRADNLHDLESTLINYLPLSPQLFDSDQITDRTDRFLIAETVREKLMMNLNRELPYALAVEIERLEREPESWQIHALVWVEREGQKRIVIGKGGSVLKKVGTAARRELESMFEVHINLKLWVKVKAGWSDDQRALHSLGIVDLE